MAFPKVKVRYEEDRTQKVEIINPKVKVRCFDFFATWSRLQKVESECLIIRYFSFFATRSPKVESERKKGLVKGEKEFMAVEGIC